MKLEQLIPDLAEHSLDINSWISIVGRWDHAIAYGNIFWPSFTLYEDCILITGFSESDFKEWKLATNGKHEQIEAVLNHRHILDMFGQQPDGLTREGILHLGRLLRDMWFCKLNSNFPGREFEVSFDEDFHEELCDYEITFCQLSQAKMPGKNGTRGKRGQWETGNGVSVQLLD